MKYFTKRIIVVLFAALLLSSCTSYTFDSTTPSKDVTTLTTIAKINQAREAFGSKPLAYNSKLAAAAQTQATLMASRNEMSHELGGTLRERVTSAGYIGAVGENLAGGHQTLEAAIEGWLQSPTHRSTLLTDKFTEFGLAKARVPKGTPGKYDIYWSFIAGGNFAAWQ